MRCPTCPISGPCRGETAVRICDLVNPAHADYRPSYLAVLAVDESPQVDPASLAETLRLTRLARGCLYRSPPSCSCEGAASCALKGGSDVSAATCWECVRAYGA
ncbi:MAG: hypothetical protein KGL39_27365 [Patescibacteria group bacterium]|nr:hypothetical protein [Patescibacteria group bacterium]